MIQILRIICGMATGFSLSFATAQESLYLVNQKKGESTVTMDMNMGDANFSGGRSQAQSLGLEYRRSLDAQKSIWVETRLMGRRFSTAAQGAAAGVGLADLELGYKDGRIYDLVSLVFGSQLSLSPGATQDPRLGRIEGSNNFSGTQSIAGYVGFESYSEALAVGGQMELRIFSDIRAVDGDQVITVTNRNRFVPRFSGFVEVPVTRSLDIGFQGAIARPDFSLDRYLFGGVGNQYEAGFYGHWDFDTETAALVQLTAKSRKYPLSEESFDIGIGLRRTL